MEFPTILMWMSVYVWKYIYIKIIYLLLYLFCKLMIKSRGLNLGKIA